MKRVSKAPLGVTLLEIMLVLAIAAMIIVMSIRYYQSTSQTQQANSFLQQVQAVTAVVENLAVGTGDYSGVKQSSVVALLPGGNNSLNPPWSSKTMTFTGTATGYTLTNIQQPLAAICALVKRQLQPAGTSVHYTVDANCTSVTYKAAV